jgi:hypothetical protein
MTTWNLTCVRKFHMKVHVDGLMLRLWIAATNRPIVHLPGDIWAWRTTMEWYWHGKTDLSTRAVWQSYQQSSSSKTWGTGKGNYEFCLMKYLFRTLNVSLTCWKILQHGADVFMSPLKEGLLWIFIVLKNPLPSAGFELANQWQEL